MKEVIIDGVTYIKKPEPKFNYVAFILSMPNRGSWNGRWSGEDSMYCVIKPYNKSYDNIINESFYYNFGDGWGASIKVERIDGNTSRKYRKLSKGFCGYDWMINSIISHGKIILECKQNE